MFVTFTVDEPLTKAETEAAYALAETQKVRLSHVNGCFVPARTYRVEGRPLRVWRFYKALEKL